MGNGSKTSTVSDSINRGRRSGPFVPTPEWILVAGLSAPAQALYTALLAHVNHQREDHKSWPGMQALAELLGYSKRQSVSRYLAELEAVGAVTVEAEVCATGRRNAYYVHETPPAEYAGLRTLAEWHRSRRVAGSRQRRMSATADIPPNRGSSAVADKGSSPTADKGSSAGADKNQRNRTRRSEREESTSSDACAAGPRAAAAGEAAAAATRARIKIYTPRGFHRWGDARAAQYLTSAAIAAMKESGLVPAETAADAIGHTLADMAAAGKARQNMADTVEHWVNVAGTSDDNGGWLATPA